MMSIVPSIATQRSVAPLTRRRVWALAVPIILSNVSEPLVGYFDLLAAGHLETTVEASALTLASSAYLLLMWTFGFLRLTTGGFSAQAFGAKDQLQQRSVFQRAALLALCLSLFSFAVHKPFFMAAEWVYAMREGQQVDLAETFFSIRIFGAPASLLLFVSFGWLIGLQRMRWVFALQLGLNFTNIGLNMLFTFHFGWGVAGIALASNIATYGVLMLALILIWRLGGFERVALTYLFNSRHFRDLVVANRDLMVRSLAIEATFVYMLRVGNMRDEVFATANGIILRFHEIAAFGLDGFAIAAESLTGAAYGAGSVTAYRRALKLTTEAAVICALVWSSAFFFFGEALIQSLTDKPEIQHAAQSLLMFGALSPLLGVLAYQLDGVYFGLTQTRALMVSMLGSTLLFFVLAHFGFVMWFGIIGLWWAYVVFMISRTVTLALGLPRLTSLVERREKLDVLKGAE